MLHLLKILETIYFFNVHSDHQMICGMNQRPQPQLSWARPVGEVPCPHAPQLPQTGRRHHHTPKIGRHPHDTLGIGGCPAHTPQTGGRPAHMPQTGG